MATIRICSIPDCGKAVKARGFCKSHYNRFMAYGDPLAGQAPRGAPLAWVLAHLDHKGDECLIWPYGQYCEGRGAILVEGKSRYVHRYMCEIVHGEQPSPQHEVAHSCGKGHLGCVHPQHIRWATRSENCIDRTIHGTQNRGERCGNAKLNRHQIRTIRATKGVEKNSVVAARYGVSETTIYNIHRRKLWGWLP